MSDSSRADALLPLVCSLGFVSSRSVVQSLLAVSRALHSSLPPQIASLDISAFASSSISLAAAIARFPNLRGLDFSWCTQVTDTVLANIAAQFPRLTSLRLRGCAQLTDEAVMCLADHCACLVTLDLGGCRSIGDASLTDLVCHSPGLEEVAVDGTSVTSAAIVVMARRCRSLSVLNAAGGGNMELALIALADCCRGLRRINLEKCRGVTAAAVVALARLCLHLESINLNLCGRSVTDEAVTALATNCRALREVQLCYSGTTDIAVANIAHCCLGLQEIDVSECPITMEVTVDNLLEQCHKLRLLTVSPRFSEECYRRWSARVTLVVDKDYETPTQAADEDGRI